MLAGVLSSSGEAVLGVSPWPFPPSQPFLYSQGTHVRTLPAVEDLSSSCAAEPDMGTPELKRPRPLTSRGPSDWGVPREAWVSWSGYGFRARVLGPLETLIIPLPRHTVTCEQQQVLQGRLGERPTAFTSRGVLGPSSRGPGLPFLQGPGSENWLKPGASLSGRDPLSL